MSNVVFLFENFNPNIRTTFFRHKSYTNYLGYSEFAIKNTNTEHGLFGIIDKFPDIENMKDIEPINQHIIKLANNKIPFFVVPYLYQNMMLLDLVMIQKKNGKNFLN